MKKEFEFNAEDLVKAVEETRDHVIGKRRITMRTTDVDLPPRTSGLQPGEVAGIRRRLNLSQSVFAQLLNVPTVTAVSWEKGRRHPSGAALRLLQVARKDPEILMSFHPAAFGSLDVGRQGVQRVCEKSGGDWPIARKRGPKQTRSKAAAK